MTSLRAGAADPALVLVLYMPLPADWPFIVVCTLTVCKIARLLKQLTKRLRRQRTTD